MHVVVRLDHPAEFLPAVLAHPVASPYRPGPPVFNGAYCLKAWLPGRPLHAVANPYYRAANSVDIQRVAYLGIADENVEILRYRAGSIDVTGGLPVDEVQWARAHLPGQLQLAPQASVFFLGLNLRSGALSRLPLVRRALAMTIDRDRLTQQVLRAGQVPAYGLVPPAMPGHARSVVAWTNISPEARLQQARVWYASAGFSANHPLRLRLLYNRNTTVRRAVLAIALMWREALGVEVEMVDEEFGRFLALRQAPNGWDVVRLGWNADYADAASFLEVFQSSSSDNTVGYVSEKYDAHLATAMSATGTERTAALQAAEAELLAADAIVPVYFLATRRLVRPLVKTGQPNLMNHNYTRYWRWATPVAGSPPAS
jgi:oligopeptide transport system substrate-binding protein